MAKIKQVLFKFKGNSHKNNPTEKNNHTRKDQWTKEQINFVRDNYKNMQAKEIAAKLGRTYFAVRAVITKYNLYKKPAPRPWTDEEIKFLKDNYQKILYPEIGKIIHRCDQSINGKLRQLGLRLPPDVLKKRIYDTFSSKGHGWNKGLKGVHNSPATEFKKGHKPANTLSDGAITMRADTQKDGKIVPYKWIRISESKWIEYHRWLWEKYNGPVPDGFCIRFKNGNQMDTRIENMELISRGENLERNAVNRSPDFRNFEHRIKSDKYIAALLARGNKAIQKDMIKNHPELIELKRTQLQLRRTINAAGK